MAEQAVKLGARAIVIKSHLVPTMDRAWLVNRKYPDVQMFGSITLNPSVGGINPHQEIGFESTIIATDGGQAELPHWSQMITEYIQYMADHGVAGSAIQMMSRVTPAKLLDLQ